MSLDAPSFQDLMHGNHCFGCGPKNASGLRIKSYWADTDISECRFLPETHHCAGPEHFLNGGVIATIIDCHSVCTAMAKAYQLAGREIGQGEHLWFATGQLNISYKRPVAIDHEVLLTARVEECSERKIWLDCDLSSKGKTCAEARVLAVKVPSSWFDKPTPAADSTSPDS